MVAVDLNKLRIECGKCGVLTAIDHLSKKTQSVAGTSIPVWTFKFECESCEDLENQETIEAYDDFVKNEEENSSEEIPKKRKGGGRTVGAKDSCKRAPSHCSRCGATGRRISRFRNYRCIECEHMEVIE